MDLNRERLKNRLNVKFEPLKLQPSSTKRLNMPERIFKQFSKDKDREKDKEGSILQGSRNKSISQLRLPSLDKKPNITRLIEQKTQEHFSIKDLKQRARSIKVLPTIKVESKEPINDTITYLMRNQILNIPKIVGMLQKSQSEQFMYMRVKGIYEYQVCDEQTKGSNYITVSKNGMVFDGELVTLDKLIYEYQVYKKLKKIHFFRYYSQIKYMNKWNRGSKKAKFIEIKTKIVKLLYLDNDRILAWKMQLKNMLMIKQKGGSLNCGWVDKLTKQIQQHKQAVQNKLLQISIKLLQKYQLPVSQSFELMNKALGSLLNLNLKFQNKIRIQKQMQIIYKMGRMLQFYQLQAIAFFLITHIQTVSTRLLQKNDIYVSNILSPIQFLDITKPNYSSQKQRILLNSVVTEEINFKMHINQHDEVCIEPTIDTVLRNIKNDIKEFINKIQTFNYKIIRIHKFDFIVKNVIKPHEVQPLGPNQKQLNLRDYIFSISEYYQKIKNLQDTITILNQTLERKKQLVSPFVEIYHKVKDKANERAYNHFNYFEISELLQQIDGYMQFCFSKLHDGQYFMLGYLSQLDLKDQIFNCMNDFKDKVIATIPGKIKQQKKVFNQKIMMHLNNLRMTIKTADDFIKIYTECDELEDKIVDYSGDLNQIQKFQELYLRVKKVESNSLVEEKSLLSQLKMRVKNYKQTKQNSFLIYRKQLQNSRKELIAKVDSILPNQQYYQISEHSLEIYNKCHSNNAQIALVSKSLKHLNELENYFDLKITIIGKLESISIKFQSLEEIWFIYKEYDGQIKNIYQKNIFKIQALSLIKKFESFMRKVERYNKDPDYFKIGQHLLHKMPLMLSSLQFIEQLKNPMLRKQDYDQITNLFKKDYKITKLLRQLSFELVYESKLFEARQSLMQISFKSQKQQQISKMVRQFQFWWKNIRLQGQFLQQYPLIIIFNDNDHIRKQIQQHSTILLNIINHKYGTFARKQCNMHLRNINALAQLLELAIIHQEKFLSLFPILTSKYAEKQLPTQAKKFISIIQKTMKNIKMLVKPTQNLNESTKLLLNNHIKHFDTISKVLGSFLQKKRIKFQRFYFLQDDELLQVLVGIGAQNTIFRMFEGIKAWLIDEQGIKYGVEGIGNQKLKLKGWTYRQQQPEVIFKTLQDAIKANLNSIVRRILHSYENQLKQLKNLYPGMPWMCVYTVELILFTKQIQINCFQNQVKLTMQIALIQQNINASIASPAENANYITLQLFLLHYTQELRHQNVHSIFDFKWHSFLRYYYEKDNVVMKALGSEHTWGGQYQGMWNLMINTSDIRRAHTSILSNIKYGNGVLLQGPSGTGKTQSLKELARCMAKYCVIFNCSSQVNIRTLQKLLSGLCYTGSWLCLDEINRLTAEIMSIVANQINSIKNAVVQKKQVFSFLGKDMKLKYGVGIFSTMNPIYLKRAKLTENLKSYFRIISVNVPDYQKILQVLLYSQGISSSSKYSVKISSLFKNLSIQLSECTQYDFGLRAMKSFIYNLSAIRKTVKNEEQSIIEGLYNTFYSRLDEEDKETFLKVLSDILGKKVEPKSSNYKINIMKEAPQTGIIVLGPTSTKTTIIKQYISSFNQHTLHTEIFNPNSIDLKYFLGQNIMGRWEQGIVEKMARSSFQNQDKNYILILDSKLRSQTIQNFNTLLDQSKLLSLANGTRLKIHNNFKVVMETPDLQMTSPATITRCNVIFVSQQDIDKNQLINKSLPTLNSHQAHQKLCNILSQFSFSQIHKISKLYRLLFFRSFSIKQKLTESETIGLQKCMIFAIQLLGLQQKVKSFMNKDNSISTKRNMFHHCISFSKYKEGQFIELDSITKEVAYFNNVYISTIKDRFYQYINSHVYDKNQYILWKGRALTGKTTAINQSIQHIYTKKENTRNIIKITIHPQTVSRTIASFIQERITVKKDSEDQEEKLLIFIDDIHMGNQQIKEFIRFTTEYNKIFSYKNKEMIPLPKHVLIADSSNYEDYEFVSRFCRQFAQVSMPSCDDHMIKAIFNQLILTTLNNTRTSPQFKQTFQIQLDRIVSFLSDYISTSNNYYKESANNGTAKKQNLQFITYCQLLGVIRNLRILNDKNCQDNNDLMTFIFSQLRHQEVDHKTSQKQLDFLKLSYSQVYKHRFHHQYDLTLKSSTGHPAECIRYSSLQSGVIKQIQNWQNYKNILISKIQQDYYISEFVLLEIMKLLRVLEWNQGNYYLIGNPGVGRRTILKIGSLITNKQLNQILPTQDKKIPDWYFSLLKTAFEKQKEQTVIIQLDNAVNFKLVSLIDKMNGFYPIKSLLNTQNCDFAYNSATDLQEIDYEKHNKAYDEVIIDFITIMKTKVQFLFYSKQKQVQTFASSYHYTYNNTLFRFIDQFPAESMLQISSQILEHGLTQEVDKKGLTNIFLKIYNDLVALMKQNEANHSFHFKYNPFYHFKVIKKFIANFKLVVEKAREKEDILNRSILKVHQISQMLQKLKAEIKQMEPKVKQKTDSLLQVVPILEEKKRASEEVKLFVLSQKRQIQTRNSEIEEMMRMVQEKIQKAEPILQQANDSMLTIKRSQLSELRNNPNPHNLIRFTLQNMVILLGESQSWQNIKKVLSDTNLLPKLKSISPNFQSIQKARRRIEQNPEWTFENVSKVSYGVRYMVRWINNIIKFYDLKITLDSEHSKVNQYKKQLFLLEQKLSNKQHQLDQKQNQIKKIEEQYTFNKNELINLQSLINLNNKKLQNAELIKNHLHEQINNWYDRLNQFKSLKKNAESTSVIITLYLQIFITLHNQEQETIIASLRQNLQKCYFSFDPAFNILQYIKDNIIQQQKYNKQNDNDRDHAADLLSLTNLGQQDLANPKIIQTLYHINNRPIILDPDNQAMTWLERQLSSEDQNGMKIIITKQSFISSVKNVELAMREGHILVLLIEQDLDAFTLQVLNSKVNQTSTNRIINYNKNSFSINKNFRLLMCNKSRNPNLSKKIYIDYSVLNFQITKHSLKNILLKELIMLQNKAVYNIRKKLQFQKKMNQKSIQQMQHQIIDSLISSKKTLIDDNQFINLLNSNQARRNILKENQTEWNQKNTGIKKMYNNYENLSEQISEIFISLKYMSKINPILSWNTQIFVSYFLQSAVDSISVSIFDEDDDEEVVINSNNIRNSNFQFDHYSIGLGNSRPNSALSYISGLSQKSPVVQERKDDFEEDHPVNPQAFQNLIGLKDVQTDEKQRGTMTIERESKIKNRIIQYLKPAFGQNQRIIWGLVLCLMNNQIKDIRHLLTLKAKRKTIKQYIEAGQLNDRIKNFISKNSERVEQELVKVFNSANPFQKLSDQLSQIQILLLGKLLDPNNFNNLCQILIKNKGYEQVIRYSQITTQNWFQRSDNVHPILLVMGEDPIFRISQYLAKKRYKNVILIPMGQGQNKLAEIVLQKQSRKQNVVIIHNLQISQNFMIYLSKMLQQFQIKPPHKNFRLILISTMFETLNEDITSFCHKYMIEQPMGIKNQIRYLRQQSTVNLVHPYHKKLQFVLTYMHSIINNLSKYKPYGWNIKYQFHTTDYLNAMTLFKQIAQNPLDLVKYECNIDLQQEKQKLKTDEIDFKALRYMIGEIGYIGKLSDDIDRYKMTILINQFINHKIFHPNHESQGLNHIKFSKLDINHIDKIIQTIPQHDATIFGLHPAIKPVSQNSHSILSLLAAAFHEKEEDVPEEVMVYNRVLGMVGHKFQYINREINKHNSIIQKMKHSGLSESLLMSLGNGFLLSTISPVNKVFNLKCFSNPREFFISVAKQVAHKNNVMFQKVELVWTFSPKQNATGIYGVCNLKLEGGSIAWNGANGILDDGIEENDIILYVQGVVKKKERQNKKMVAIPLYLEEQRQGQINSYGDNTNLLVKVKLQSNRNQEFWILRSTAFVAL